jgi:hypothetical protein
MMQEPRTSDSSDGHFVLVDPVVRRRADLQRDIARLESQRDLRFPQNRRDWFLAILLLTVVPLALVRQGWDTPELNRVLVAGLVGASTIYGASHLLTPRQRPVGLAVLILGIVFLVVVILIEAEIWLGADVQVSPIYESVSPWINLSLMGIGIILALYLIGTTLSNPVGLLDVQLEVKRRELDLLEAADESDDVRAEKQLNVQQVELQRYYVQTLAHSHLIFLAGLVCLALGFAIIAFTLYAVIWHKQDQDVDVAEQLVLAALGIMAGLLTNFVAVVQLRMFSEQVRTLTDFHNRLVLTHLVHIANFLVAKVKDQNRREEALVDMAKHLVAPNLPGPVGATWATPVDPKVDVPQVHAP